MFVQKEGKNIFIVRLKRSGDDQEQTIPFCVLPARHKMLFYKLTQTQTHIEKERERERWDERMANVRVRHHTIETVDAGV